MSTHSNPPSPRADESAARRGSGPSGLRGAFELLSSMRFAVALLVVLAIASIIGTVLAQGDPYPNYVNQFGPFWADIFRALGLFGVYGAWWFMLILIFLVLSISLCVLRNAPKMLADAKSWKDRVRENSLRAFHHKAEYAVARPRAEVAAKLAALAGRMGYRHVTRASAQAPGQSSQQPDGATLIAAKRGALARLGYIFAHVAIVVICAGGLLDSSLPVKFQMWVLGKRPLQPGATSASPGPEHRLSASNPSFRGDAWVPEGQSVSSALINEPDGVLVQDLPFSILLKKFTVDYYSTGMPKLFASDIVVIDRETGAQIPARVEVNKPFTYKGVSIYQSGFQDGGSLMQMSAYPMRGAGDAAIALKGNVNGAALPLPGGETVEITDFRAINVENLSGANADDGNAETDASSPQSTQSPQFAQPPHPSFETMLDKQLGSGAKSSVPTNLHDVGPSFQYRVRDASGQASEYSNYMRPVTLEGERVFLAGVRTREDEPFRYIYIPADANGSIDEWMRLRAALADPGVRAQAARRFAQRTLADGAHGALRAELENSARRALDLFAGAGGVSRASNAGGMNGASGENGAEGANSAEGVNGADDTGGAGGSGTNNGISDGVNSGVNGGINGDISGDINGGINSDTGGSANSSTSDANSNDASQDARAVSGGFPAVGAFLDHSVPQADRQKFAGIFMRLLEGVTWDAWQIARERAHEPDAPSIEQDADARRFVQSSLNAVSDSFAYGAPVYLKLDAFQQVQASVFGLTRAPGTAFVYAGSLLLVAGIFSMFYVRERRLWFWLKDTPAGASVVMAMSCARKNLDFERDFERLRAATSAALGVAPRVAASRADKTETADALDVSGASERPDAPDTPDTADAASSVPSAPAGAPASPSENAHSSTSSIR